MSKKNANKKKRVYLIIYDDYFEFGDIKYTKEEVESYYRVHIDKDCAKRFGVCLSNFKKIVEKWGMKKTPEEIKMLTKQTLKRKYGDPTYNNKEKKREYFNFSIWFFERSL